MTLQQLYRKRKEIEARIFKLEMAWVFLSAVLFIECYFFSKGNYVPITLAPCLIGIWLVVFPLHIMARGELFETLKEMDELLKHITNVREKMKAHWREDETSES